ncbi:alpha/beta hydrolase fold domain-containing protein [uncultured Roseibium sp.]|uniref:alpha/beta hydrolase n=1 Tax=uncultured Roseibium sp. TaxID=1936171 RepID=UPI003217F3E7
MLDPQIEEMDRKRMSGAYPDPFEADTTAEARRRAWAIRRDIYPSPQIDVGKVEDKTISGPAGEIAIRIVHPAGNEAASTVVYFHGGAWMVGDLDSHHAHVSRIANRAGAVVVNVDYRLAPDNLFPAATDDAFAAFDWVIENLAGLGGNPQKVAVGGDSAGGALAAACAIRARDMGVPLAAQLLVYPVCDMRNKDGENNNVIRKYLGPNYKVAAQDWRASPAAAILAGVAPAVIGTGVYDFLHEENKRFAELLEAAGVPVTLRIFPDLNHSFFSYAGVSQKCEDASNLLCDDLRDILAG